MNSYKKNQMKCLDLCIESLRNIAEIRIDAGVEKDNPFEAYIEIARILLEMANDHGRHVCEPTSKKKKKAKRKA